MKQILILLTIAVFTTACGEGSSQNVNFNQAALEKMNSSDFDAQVTLEIMSGKLKGKHVFNKIKEGQSNRIIQISMKSGPGYKDEITKPGSLFVGTTQAEQSGLYLINMTKSFVGMIKEGSYPAKGSPWKISLENKTENPQWIRAYGEVLTQNDIIFEAVGEWLTIKRNNEVRRVKGYFTEQVEFGYNDRNKQIAKETSEVKVTFDVYEAYRPKKSDKVR